MQLGMSLLAQNWTCWFSPLARCCCCTSCCQSSKLRATRYELLQPAGAHVFYSCLSVCSCVLCGLSSTRTTIRSCLVGPQLVAHILCYILCMRTRMKSNTPWLCQDPNLHGDKDEDQCPAPYQALQLLTCCSLHCFTAVVCESCASLRIAEASMKCRC